MLQRDGYQQNTTEGWLSLLFLFHRVNMKYMHRTPDTLENMTISLQLVSEKPNVSKYANYQLYREHLRKSSFVQSGDADLMMWRSTETVSTTCGLCTLTATTSPVFRRPLYTCTTHTVCQ